MNLFTLVKERVPILDVISQHTVLKKLGHYWKGQCPFHSERTASFAVSPHRSIFYCFGCQASGDVIGFVSKLENCTQFEAAKQLAERYNIDIPESVLHEPTVSLDQKKRYFLLCQVVATWCQAQLQKNASALSYVQRRDLSQRSIDTFSIGYFPEGERSIKDLIKEVSKHSILVDDLMQAGIVNEGKSLYSPFEGRIMFPIKDHLGHNCGFGGRVFKEDDQRSKYYNSKENPFFQKGSLLFGFDSAKREIQKTGSAFLVEGYTDCIAMAQQGYLNTVATLGTACTLEHLKLLSNHAHTLYVMYDSDAAGQKATLRLAQLCWEANLEIKVVVLPGAKDPAAFFEQKGDLKPLLAAAQDILHFFLSSLGKDFATQPLTLKLQAARSFLDCIRKLSDPLKRDILLKRAAETFELPLQSLKHEMSLTTQPARVPSSPLKQPLEIPELSSLEKNFLCAIMNKTDLLENTQVKDLLDYFPEPFKAILDQMRSFFAGENALQPFSTFFDSLEEVEKSLLNQILFTEVEEEADFEQTVLLLEKKYWKKIVVVTKQRLARAQEVQDLSKVKSIVESFLELKKRLLHKGLI